jgi:thiol-disulfide isomerase/thioredoxin
MANVITYIYEILQRNHIFYRIGMIVLVLLFVGVAYYAYNTFYKKPKENKMKDVANMNDRTGVIEIYFFHVNWCPHCKTAEPEWDAFKSKYQNKEVNGYKIQCISIDCTDDSGDKNKDIDEVAKAKFEQLEMNTTEATNELIRRYNIDSYPTIKMVKDNDTIDFDAKITTSSLSKFVDSMTSSS